MGQTTACRRMVRRFRIPTQAAARVEFEHPSPNGLRHSLPLLDVSVSGVSFALGDEPVDVEIGATLPRVLLGVGRCEIRGDLLVMHRTPEDGPHAICGALFYPETDTDLIKLRSLVAGIEAVHSG